MHTVIGILAGVLAATLQSCSYVFSGRYMRESGRGMFPLLAPSFALMSVLSFAILPFFFLGGGAAAPMPPLGAYAGAALLCIFFCLLGHAGLFFMLKSVDASRASPLLAAKVPLLALFYTALGEADYTLLQWLGVALVIPAAWLLCKAGRRIPAAALAWLLFGCAAYGLSDHCIKIVLEAFRPHGPALRGYMLVFLVVYASGGVFGAAGLLCGLAPERRQFLRAVLPFSAFWFAAMAALFICFGMIGIVNGNIVQSLRGLISVGMGWLIARAGFEKLEERSPASVFAKRLLSAAMAALALALFNLGAAR